MLLRAKTSEARSFGAGGIPTNSLAEGKGIFPRWFTESPPTPTLTIWVNYRSVSPALVSLSVKKTHLGCQG